MPLRVPAPGAVLGRLTGSQFTRPPAALDQHLHVGAVGGPVHHEARHPGHLHGWRPLQFFSAGQRAISQVGTTTPSSRRTPHAKSMIKTFRTPVRTRSGTGIAGGTARHKH